LPCATAPLPVVPQQNSYTQNIIDFDRSIGVFSTNPSTYFSDGSTVCFRWYAETAHDLTYYKKKNKNTYYFQGKKLHSTFFSFNLAILVFCVTKIGRKTKKFQNISQDKLQAEL
jgi:hypothetical protein